MKVKIGHYKNWIGPYQIADRVPFTSEETKEKIGDWIAGIGWVNSLCNWVYRLRGDRVVKVHIDKYDTWNMDETLAYIIVPMLKQLKETKHGSPLVDNEDVPEQMRYEGENWVHYKWEWVLNEMIWAFETRLDENFEDQFQHGTPDFQNVVHEDGSWSYEQTNPDYYYDFPGYEAYQLRMTNGFRLFGRYYQSLWD